MNNYQQLGYDIAQKQLERQAVGVAINRYFPSPQELQQVKASVKQVYKAGTLRIRREG